MRALQEILVLLLFIPFPWVQSSFARESDFVWEQRIVSPHMNCWSALPRSDHVGRYSPGGHALLLLPHFMPEYGEGFLVFYLYGGIYFQSIPDELQASDEGNYTLETRLRTAKFSNGARNPILRIEFEHYADEIKIVGADLSFPSNRRHDQEVDRFAAKLRRTSSRRRIKGGNKIIRDDPWFDAMHALADQYETQINSYAEDICERDIRDEREYREFLGGISNCRDSIYRDPFWLDERIAKVMQALLLNNCATLEISRTAKWKTLF